MVAKTLFILFLLYMCGQHYSEGVKTKVQMSTANDMSYVCNGERAVVSVGGDGK